MTRLTPLARGVRRIRLERGLTLAQLGSLLGVHSSTVSRIESGQRWRGLIHEPQTVAALLGVTQTYLMRSCPQCAYAPPVGYRCLRCGTANEGCNATSSGPDTTTTRP